MSPDDGEFGRYDTTFYSFFFLLFITNNRSLRWLAEAVVYQWQSDALGNGAV
jgi:hypothetical protein